VWLAVVCALSCPPIPKRQSPPRDIYDLAPGDLDIVMALGDSITAGFGIESLVTESRTCSFSIGDGKQCHSVTLPHLLHMYNPKVKGASSGSHLVEPRLFDHIPRQDNLNAAQTGAFVQDLKSQIDYLVEQFGLRNIDVFRTWKHVTILIGANNLCNLCEGNLAHDSADTFEVILKEALIYLYENFPKTFVSLVSIPKFTNLEELETSTCKVEHNVYAECNCVFRNPTKEKLEELDANMDEFNYRLTKIAAEWTYKGLKDFAVVNQPFLVEQRIPSEEWLSPYDCFHPSRKAHQALAVNLWNSLFLPVSQKSTKFDMNITDIHCPDIHSRLQVF